MNRRATILAVVTSAAVVGTLGVLGLSTALAATAGPITGRSLGRDRQCPGAYPNYDTCSGVTQFTRIIGACKG
jgi:hypothetical protein